MISQDHIEQFNEFAISKVYFYLESDFWSKPSMAELHNWLANFSDGIERYCALKLLDRFVYYSETDIIHLLKYGIEEKIFKRHLLSIEQKNDFKIKGIEISKIRKEFFDKLYFIKLDTQNPSPSSEAMLRHLKIDVGFPESNILDNNNLQSSVLDKCENLVILDDFIGSGTQIRNFWNYGKVSLDGNQININQLESKFSNLSIEYFCLVCTKEGFENFKFDYGMGVRTDLRITYSEILSNKFKIFSKESMYFESTEIEFCKDILQKLCKKNKINFLGYESLDYGIAFHHGIPDCSLPLFYRMNSTWNYLFRNKKTTTNV